MSAMGLFGKMTRRLLSRTKDSFGVYVINRKTSEAFYEEMPLYIRVGLNLLFVGQLQTQAIESGLLDGIFERETRRQGELFDSPNSVRHIDSFIRAYNLSLDELKEPDPTKYPNFNAFFHRELREGARPVDSIDNSDIIVCPSDSRLVVFKDLESATDLWVKGKHFTLQSLLGSEELATQFHGGSLAIFRLAPQDYHRFHTPVEVASIDAPLHHPGKYYTVNPQAINGPLDILDANARTVSILHSPGREEGASRKVAYVAVGALLVGSIQLTATGPTRKGDELGYFAYGGSTVVCVWPKNQMVFDEDLVRNTVSGRETLVRVGEKIGWYV
ncbi:phosphatidylserine decarboxylase-domain-containing protein [Piptocephalis cylindrospora]|uniref:Phosphatidylserine decarboxylase-domain-containing protein n=1 Tax=Piptocephalis cylindrospora TaxID=1907219 RepID=A0A4P9Y3I8_9FUNG|nr:phosphatidylserine decarboxylase-domain-containing protein [Piptocephalis cylindrospora]|eukprot:RKP13363.1 phosphatidylserine decarboxylase-domain-containing protein [Piptocephalis cylindrospora]